MGKKVNRSQIVYEQIKGDILKGVFSPNESLKEVEISEKYNISRNTLKVLLTQLESEGLVVLEPNKGAKIRNYSLSEVLDFLAVRACLEGFIVKITTDIISDESLNEMGLLLGKMKEYLDQNDFINYSRNNQVFHNYIYDACPNEVVVTMVRDLKLQMSKYNTRTILVPGRSTDSYTEHMAILQAMKDRDSAKADELMQAHILHVRKTFEDNYDLLF